MLCVVRIFVCLCELGPAGRHAGWQLDGGMRGRAVLIYRYSLHFLHLQLAAKKDRKGEKLNQKRRRERERWRCQWSRHPGPACQLIKTTPTDQLELWS